MEPNWREIEVMSTVLEFLGSSANSAVLAMQALVWPLLFFSLLGLIVKRRAFLTDLMRAFPASTVNVGLMLFNVVFVGPLIVVLSQWMHHLFDDFGLRLVNVDAWAGVHPAIVVLIAVFAGDFAGYWRHRLEHTPILWPSHAVHHSDEEMTWLTLQRFHPVNRVTTFVFDTAVLLALGLPPFAVIANNWVRHYYGYFIHADLPWTFGRASLLFVSPAMHRWHHAADPRYFQTNFATVFSVFDRLFGTYRVPGPCTAPLGVTDDMRPTVVGQLSYMLQPRAYRSITGRKATLFRWRANDGERVGEPGDARDLT